VPETCFPIRPSNGRGVSKDRHAAYLIKARRTNLHPKAGYIDADFLSLNFSLAFTRRTIHIGNFDGYRTCSFRKYDFSGSSARDSVLVETPSDIFLDIRE
jgi:hypothetical protein